MTQLGTINFDDGILDALRDDKLVVFAGAGVSMGPPSNLPSFSTLTTNIAQGTGYSPTEPLDRFLGQLHHRKVVVHERAAKCLTPPAGSKPNTLHQDLLRLFRTAERVRLVTTNFDLHFETAASTLFGSTPEVYRAPALPLGYDFTGIVHVHGALPRAQDLVLTDADFGRAYLTEGWARRFLVDVFRQFTVLFVGYSHNDVVMHYLARALPADSVVGRFALTDEEGNWNLLGIKSILFTKGTDADAYKELYEGVQRLAERAIRGALDWQSRMAEIGGRIPPADVEAISEVEQALREVHTTRFLTNVARDAEWPRWLNARKHLDALFGTVDLSERDKLLGYWLAEHFAIAHADTVFELVAAHGLQLNPQFWQWIVHELGVDKDKPLNESTLKRWVTILLASAPKQAEHYLLMGLAERCTNYNAVPLTLKVFLTMSEHRLSIKLGFRRHDEEDHARGRHLDVDCPLRADHWTLNEAWTKHIKPHLAVVAEPLLSVITCQLEDIHGTLSAWEKASLEWDPVSYGRSAIELHEQDQYPEAIDVLIDAARDALEWLATNAPVLLDAWVERFATSDVPLLRRLAIHAITVHPGKSADDRLNWLLARVGLHPRLEHHEVYRAVARSYKDAGDDTRRAVVDAILTHQLSEIDGWTAERRTARSHFDWLSWLLCAKPDCAAVEAALVPIRAAYPDWRLSEHPDLTHWHGSAGWVGSQSPWSIEQLLARTPREQLDDLLNFQGKRFDGPGRDGLIATIREVCKQNTSWAFNLAEVLAERSLWTSDLWPAVIQGLQESELLLEDWRTLLAISARTELLTAHAHDVANLLYALVSNGGKPFALELMEQANVIALPLWQALQPNVQDDDLNDWLSRAINRPAGVIIEFWINGLSLLLRGKNGAERALPDNYRQWFTMVVQDATSKGGLGRSLLTCQVAFLFGLDELWTRQHLIPLFSHVDQDKFDQAWDGFLVWGQLSPALGEALRPAFLGALQRLSPNVPNRRHDFIKYYAALAVFHVADPTQQLLPALFWHGSVKDRVDFTFHLGNLLRDLHPDTKQQMWNTWLCQYWQNRLHGVPVALDAAEIAEMLEWLPSLGEIFSKASLLAIQAPPIRIEHSRLLFELRNSDLVTRYPAETAELLIYLCKCDVDYTFLGKVAERLPALASDDLRCRLDEALVRVL